MSFANCATSLVDAGLTKNMTALEPLVQENDKPIEPGFGRPCTRSVTRIQSFTIPLSYVPEMHELDQPIPIVKTVGGYHDLLAAREQPHSTPWKAISIESQYYIAITPFGPGFFI